MVGKTKNNIYFFLYKLFKSRSYIYLIICVISHYYYGCYHHHLVFIWAKCRTQKLHTHDLILALILWGKNYYCSFACRKVKRKLREKKQILTSWENYLESVNTHHIGHYSHPWIHMSQRDSQHSHITKDTKGILFASAPVLLKIFT